MNRPAELNRLARMCEAAKGPDGALGRDVLILAARWRLEGSALYSPTGFRSSDGTPDVTDDPTRSIDASRRISPAALETAHEGFVRLADGSEGKAKTLALAYAAAVCRAWARRIEGS